VDKSYYDDVERQMVIRAGRVTVDDTLHWMSSL
jgi:hypothetical protein